MTVNYNFENYACFDLFKIFRLIFSWWKWENPRKTCKSQRRDTNSGPPKYEAKVINIRSFIFYFCTSQWALGSQAKICTHFWQCLACLLFCATVELNYIDNNAYTHNCQCQMQNYNPRPMLPNIPEERLVEISGRFPTRLSSSLDILIVPDITEELTTRFNFSYTVYILLVNLKLLSSINLK